jgi:GIY-YIG catalytic domain
MHASLIRSLTDPPRLWSRAEVLTRPCPVPKSPGVYAWYFRPPPAGVPLDGCTRQGNLVLLYIGISPKEPPRDGRPGSRQALASRIRYHYHGNAEGSTLRLTLGCLLAEELGLDLRRVGGGQRLTFTYEGERRLSDWMGAHAFVAWVETPQPWLLEVELLRALSLPLNLDGNRHHSFREKLSALRAATRARARTLPVIPG